MPQHILEVSEVSFAKHLQSILITCSHYFLLFLGGILQELDVWCQNPYNVMGILQALPNKQFARSFWELCISCQKCIKNDVHLKILFFENYFLNFPNLGKNLLMQSLNVY